MIQAKMRKSVKKVAIVTTTINVPILLRQYVDDWNDNPIDDVELCVIVSGDVQTPPPVRSFIEALNGTYIDVQSPASTRWKINDHIGLRSIQRRNIATLHAIGVGADVIITVDDDNEPDRQHVRRMLEELNPGTNKLLSRSSGWFNPGELLNPRVISRGLPLHRRFNKDVHYNSNSMWLDNVGVVQGLTIGDPDIDAIERIVNRPIANNLIIDDNVVLDYGTWAPFNTQNTAFTRELTPLFFCMIGVGRYDDIFSSYVARAIMDASEWRVSYGHPSTYSARNTYDDATTLNFDREISSGGSLIDDLEREIFGYRALPEFIATLRTTHFERDAHILDQLSQAYAAVSHLLSNRTNEANQAWLKDVELALKEGDDAWS